MLRYALDSYGLNGALLIMAGLTLNICVCGMLFRPPDFYFKRYIRKQEKQRALNNEETKTTALVIGEVNKHEPSEDVGANPVVSTAGLPQQRNTSDDEAKPNISDTDKNERLPEHTQYGLVDNTDSSCVKKAFSSTEVSILGGNTAMTLTDIALQSGSEDPQLSFIDVAYPSTANILALGEKESESNSCLSRWCFNPVRSWITSKKSKPTEKKDDHFWYMLTNPVVLLYATSAGVSNRLVI